MTRMIHEAPEVVDFAQKSTRQEYASVLYKLPKHVFSLYKSAEMHTKKQRVRLPSAAIALMALIPIFGGLSWLAYSRLAEKTNLGNQTAAQSAAGGLPPAGPAQPSLGYQPPPSNVPASMAEALVPLDYQNHLSAPLYAAVAPPPIPPRVDACIASKVRCTCYSQQQTPIWMPDEQCRARAAGQYYDPYRQPPQAPVGPTQHAQGSATPAQPVDVSKEKGAEAPLS